MNAARYSTLGSSSDTPVTCKKNGIMVRFTFTRNRGSPLSPNSTSTSSLCVANSCAHRIENSCRLRGSPDDGRRIALELAQQLVLQLIEQVVHVGEVLVERSAVVAGVLGHRSHRHAVDAIVAVQLPERVHELLARLRRLLRLLLHGNASDRPTLASKLSVDVRACAPYA